MQIHNEKKQDICICRVKGEINLDNVDSLAKTFKGMVDNKSRKVLLDFSSLDYIDSAGFASLIQFSKELKDIDGVLFISGLSPKIRSLFAITKLEKAFKIYDTENEALEESCGY